MSRRLLGAALAGALLTLPAAPASAASAPSLAPGATRAAAVATSPTPTPSSTRRATTKTTARTTTAKTTVQAKTTRTTTVRAKTTRATTRTSTTRVTTTLKPGSKGPQVLALQKRLASLGYWVGTPNGYYGHATTQAVMAVQKVAGLGRDGVAGPATRRAVDKGVRPSVRTRSGRAVEIDLRRQVLVFVDGGRARMVLNTSTGASATPTPRGSYRVTWGYTAGWKTAPLGKLYRPKYFHQGYAVHGVADGSVPGYPASHGCARVSTAAMDMLWKSSWLSNGAKVVVY